MLRHAIYAVTFILLFSLNATIYETKLKGTLNFYLH